MDLAIITLIAVALAMDCFAVSVTSGIAIKRLRLRNSLKIALSFGLFQGIMPIVGWAAGQSVVEIISGIDHWIAFGLLFVIGAKMIYESIKINPEGNGLNPLNLGTLILLSIATSIDALAIGLSFAFIQIDIIAPAIIIGTVAFAVSFAGTIVGNRIGHLFEKRIGIAGGAVLILLGVKILFEHLAVI